MEEHVRGVVVGHEDVREAVTIVVGKGDAHSLPADLADARGRRHVREGPVPVVVVKRVGKRGVILGMTVGAHVRVGPAEGVFVDLPFAVVRYEQVQAAVVIVVEPSGGYRPHLLAVQHRPAHSGLVGDVRKGAVAVVMKELVLGDIGDEDVRPPIVVVISHRDADAVSLALDSGLLGNIREGTVAIVVEQPVPILGRLFLQRRNGRAVDEVNVQVPVVVVIEKRHAGEHGLGQILVGRGAVVRDEVDAGAVRDFFECDRSQRRRRRQNQKRPEERECEPAYQNSEYYTPDVTQPSGAIRPLGQFRVRDHSLTVVARYRHTACFRAARVSKRFTAPAPCTSRSAWSTGTPARP